MKISFVPIKMKWDKNNVFWQAVVKFSSCVLGVIGEHLEKSVREQVINYLTSFETENMVSAATATAKTDLFYRR